MKVIHLLPNISSGGAQKSTIDIINTTEGEIENHLVLVEDKKKYTPENIKCYSLVKDKKFYKKLDLLGDFLLAKKLKKLYDEIGADLIISHVDSTSRIVKFLKVKKIHYIRANILSDLYLMKEKSYIRFLKKEFIYKLIFKGQHLITVSEDIKSDILKFIPVKSIQTIYNPFDIEKIKKLARESCEYDFPYIIHVGATNPYKRHDILLEAYKKADLNIKLVLLTDTNDKLQNMINSLGLSDKVIVAGYQQNPYPYIKNAKLLVLSSEREGLPRVLVEAVALDVPIVSTDCKSGPSEVLIEEFQNYLAKVNDAEELSQKIVLALENYPKYTEKNLQRFDRKNFISHYIDVVTKIGKNSA